MPAMRSLFAVVALVGCACARSEQPVAAEPASGAREPVAAELAPAPAATTTAAERPEPPPLDDPQGLYEQCRDRVEGPEHDGECTSDDDCVNVGCSNEVCVPASAAADLMTACEVRICYSVLQSCGCHEGRCTWTVDGARLKSHIIPRPGGPKVE